MDRVTRRQLLTRAIVAGSGATVVGALSAAEARAYGRGEAAASGATAVDPRAVDPNFVAGRVIDRGRDILVVQDPDAQFRRIRLAPDGLLWKQDQWSQSPPQVGDCLYARGSVGSDGVLAIKKAWASIFNLSGRLVRSKPGGFTVGLLRDDLGPIDLGFAPGAKSTDGRPAAAAVAALPPGTPIRVIGFESEVTGDLTATLVAGAVPSGPTPAESSAGSSARVMSSVRRGSSPEAATTSKIIYGVASWQCCGGVNGCGSQCCSCNPARCCPPPSSHGACSTCRTDQQGVAWPNLTTGCSATCWSCCVPMDRLACGQIVTICNMCSPGYCCAIPVNDCGPNLHCVAATRCQGYQVVKWDLTACTFTCCGGNLNAGFMDSQASYFI